MDIDPNVKNIAIAEGSLKANKLYPNNEKDIDSIQKLKGGFKFHRSGS